ncbi:ATPase PAAT-like isoform X2 [Montipora foliosa]|uniref:ATPase PAAT-like isoform X2 n=1 Tax=Montipora foliosa TaxID=591990 RepID=UPI0035F1C5AB
MDLEELSNFWARFQISFSWDYPDGLDIQAVQSAVFHVVGDGETRAQDQLVVGCVQSAGAGVTLTRPKPQPGLIPCEMSFTAHPMAQEFYIKNIVIVSEARNVELYIDDNYEKTARGIMLTIRKGRKVSLFETEFDLTEHIHGTCRCLIKFLSYPEEQSMRLQTIVVRVARSSSLVNSRAQGQSDRVLGRARSVSVGNGLRSDLGATNLSGSESSILSQAISRAKQLEDEEIEEKMGRDLPVSPENDADFIGMLAGLMVDKKPETATNTPLGQNGRIEAPESPTLAKHRWETYLQSRVRASRNMVRKSRPLSLGSAFPSITHAETNLRAQSFCVEDKRAVEKALAERAPASSPALLDKSEVDGPNIGSMDRCAECGCPGCLSVYNSITTNIYAAEKRIMGRVDAKLQALLDHMNSRFDSLFDSLQLLTRSSQIPVNNSLQGVRKISQRNGHKSGDTSV